MKITVVGFGSWGIALACVLNQNGHNVTIWSNMPVEDRYRQENAEYLPGVIIPKTIKVTEHISEATSFAELYVYAVPSNQIRNAVTTFLPYFTKGQIIVTGAKGLEDKTLLRMSQVIEETAPMCRAAVLSGPSHAEEVARGIPTTIVSSARDEETAETVQDIFMSPTFRVYTNSDLLGVELGGALKNVIALAAGISDGLGYGDNTKAALMTRGITEISRLGVAMGAKRETFAGLTGIGDLIVTCTSMHSRNRRAGILLGQGRSLNDTLKEVHMVVEGVNTARAAYDLSVKYNIQMPITKEINLTLFDGKNAREAVNDLMTRDRADEHTKEALFKVERNQF